MFEKENQYEYVNNKDKIFMLWTEMKNKKDFVDLLNEVLIMLYQTNTLKFDIAHLNYYTNTQINKKRYISFQIPKKKKGEYRTIDAPCQSLKTIQQCLNLLFQFVFIPHSAAKGFVPNCSILNGARVHIQQKYVYNIDLKDFFPSITSGRLYNRLQSKPFSLNHEVASIITDLCCYSNSEGKNVLPQGAPTSPTITNIICERLDRKLSKLAKAYNLKYSRYADDITFSGMVNVFAEEGKFCQSLKHIIEEEENFKINTDKTRLLHRGNRQEVTGITVNEKPNVSRKYVKQLRTLIHNWEVLGYHEAQQRFLELYKPTKNVGGEHHIENIISGKLDYLKMVKGESDTTYKKLRERFETLSQKISDTKKESQQVEINNVDKRIFDNIVQKDIVKKQKKQKVHDPKFTADFLSLFNRREGFKYLTHNYDNSGLTLNEFATEIKKIFRKYSYEPKLPGSLKALMNSFINGGEWTDFEGKKCLEGYSSENWIKWSEQNNNMHPIMDIDGIEKIIQRFRHTIRVVSPDLHNIVESITHDFSTLEFDYNAQNLGKADFYTNVFFLRRGLWGMIKDMADHNNHKNIKIEYKPGFDGDYFIRQIIITQAGSFSPKSIDEVVEKFKSKGGFFAENAEKLTGYCNWSVESLWDGTPYRWNILREENTNEIEPIEKETIKGFSHILTFYYKD